MCFGGGSRGPSQAELQQMAQQREDAERAKRQQIEERAQAKRADISEAVTGRAVREGRRGGAGRRSLFTAPMGGAGYASRF